MDIQDNIAHIAIVSCSLDVIYGESRMSGKLNTHNLYLLEVINKFLVNCESTLTIQQQNRLRTFYNDILTTSKELCNVPLQNLTSVVSKPKFVQADLDVSVITQSGIYNSVFNNTFS